MNLKLYGNWRQILKDAWSLRFIALSGIFSFLGQYVLPNFAESISPIYFTSLSGLFLFLAFASRLVSQKDI